MSRIFEALKRAEKHHTRAAEPPRPEFGNATKPPERRKNRRWPLDASVYVYGYGPGKDPFHEEAHTLNVSAAGALLLLSVPVQKGQVLLLTNELTQQEQDCRVVFLGTQHSRTVEAGVAFPGSFPEFWQTHAPREDTPAS